MVQFGAGEFLGGLAEERGEAGAQVAVAGYAGLAGPCDQQVAQACGCAAPPVVVFSAGADPAEGGDSEEQGAAGPQRLPAVGQGAGGVSMAGQLRQRHCS
ncbi:MAG TPA: hypothetical protein VN969_00365 [Streptosporangiaceae bacterium]|nr:hypothetical protein [Streptosporangiaceae bacterium]